MEEANTPQFNDPIPVQTWNELFAVTPDLANYGSGISPRKAIQSGNFKAGQSGYRIDTNGNAEFNDGTFRGTFNLGGTTITIDNTKDIQTYLDLIYAEGGGTLFLQPGTYTLTADISIPSGVTLQGVSRDEVIIDCNGNFSVKIVGTDEYEDGTVTINNGDTTVVGLGTTWTSAMIGQYIYLGSNGDFEWYEITARVSNTEITIAKPFGQNDIAGETYSIATVNFQSEVAKLTITNANNSGLVCVYTQEPIIDDIVVYGCTTGLDFGEVLWPLLVISVYGCGDNIVWNKVSGFEIKFSIVSDSTTGNGLEMTNCGNATIFDSGFTGNTGDGIHCTNCGQISFIAMDCSSNGGQGIECVSTCNDLQFVSVIFSNNTSDGLKLTATTDRCQIVACSAVNNGGYGINIAAATCDNNQIIAPAFDNNTSGNINDSGTNTFISPQTFADVPYFEQNIAAPIQNSAGQRAFGSNTTGSVIYMIHDNTNYDLYRYERDDYFGNYVITHAVNMTNPLTDGGSIVVIGSYIYVFGNDGTNVRVYRYSAANLTGEQLMTVPTVAQNGDNLAWTDGTYTYTIGNYSGTGSAKVQKWSISGTTMTHVSTSAEVAANDAQICNQGSMWDGTTAWLVDTASATQYETLILVKLTDIQAQAVTSYNYYINKYSDADGGHCCFPIDSTKMYIGLTSNNYTASAAMSSTLHLIPITKP